MFFSDPADYDGGELVVHGAPGEAAQRIKLPAGDAILYPGTSVHEVTPVTRGERLASFLWIESMVRSGEQRRLLFEMDMALLALRQRHGESPEAIMEKAAQIKLRCPLLDDNDHCLMYHARPLTCRVYGVPTAIAGQGHVCGFSAFEKGQPYPTIHLDKIQNRLEDLSREVASTVQTRFKELHDVYVPLSMALLTRYDEAYLGIGPAKKEEA